MRRMPYGYNEDGSVNPEEAEDVRCIFEKTVEYYENPPQVLIDRVIEGAEEDGKLTEEEILSRARMLINEYIAKEINERRKKRQGK